MAKVELRGYGAGTVRCDVRRLVSGEPPLQLPTSSTSRRGGYSCGFDLRLGPIRLDHVGALKRLSTEEHDLEDSQQAIDATGKDVGNCKAQTTVTKNKKQLAILKQGAEAWNAWRAEHRDIQPCFGREAAGRR